MVALTKQNIFCFGKMVLKLGIIMAIAIFPPRSMTINGHTSAHLLKGYIQRDINLQEQDENALFLLKKEWEIHLKEKYHNKNIRFVDDGIVYVQVNKKLKSRNIKINIAEINKALNSKIEIIPAVANKEIHSREKISSIAKDSDAILAINGTFFKQKTGTPLGALVINKEIISGPIYNRVGLLIGNNEYSTANIDFEGQVKKGDIEIKINSINQPRLSQSQTIIYTDKWGNRSPDMKSKCKQMAIFDGKIVAISSYPLFIPHSGFVISSSADKLKEFEIGDNVDLSFSIIPEMKKYNHIISGGPYLLKDGNIFVDVKEEKLVSITGRNPRTAIGYTKNNDLILVTVEGRKEGVSGVTLEELAKIMKDIGCHEAINLDGGSSTVMYVNGKTINGSSVEGNIKISNALVVKVKNY